MPGADFSASAVGFDAAVDSGLRGLWFFNQWVRASAKNLALGGVDADVLGTPSDQGAFLRFKGGQTPMPSHRSLRSSRPIRWPIKCIRRYFSALL